MPIPYVKETWVDGSGGGTPLSAARLGVHDQGIFDAHYMPAVRVYNSANINVNTATVTALTFNTERIDQASNVADTMHDTGINPGRLTCRYAGVYLIGATIEWAANATGERAAFIRLNGTTDIAHQRGPANAAIVTGQNVSTLYALAVNDYVEVTTFQTSGSGLNVLSTGNRSPEFYMVRVG